METLDLDLAEMLAARLCHELVSPIGAITNGLEILAEEPDFAEDAQTLITQSAYQAARRLQFYRLAYGASGAIDDDLARSTALAFFEGGKLDCCWPEGSTIPQGQQKLMLNLLLVAADCLPRGGTLTVEANPRLGINAQGDGARIPEEVASLFGFVRKNGITPRSVQTKFTRRLADRLGLRIEAVLRGEDTVSLLAVC